jgi:hypothetical protein
MSVTERLPTPTSATVVVARKFAPVITRIPLCPVVICEGEVPLTMIAGGGSGGGVVSCAIVTLKLSNRTSMLSAKSG